MFITFDTRWGFYSNSTNVNGTEMKQLFHHYPKLEPFYFNFEKSYDPVPVYHTVASDRFYLIPFTATVLYFMLCYCGPILMKKRNTWNIDGILAAWNLFLATFSFYGTARVLPHFLYRMTHLPFEATICESVYSSFAGGAVGSSVGSSLGSSEGSSDGTSVGSIVGRKVGAVDVPGPINLTGRRFVASFMI
eukprot:gene12460-13631_t